MENMNNRVDLLKAMNEIVEKQVKHYKNDFIYDIDYIYTIHDKKIIWIARKCGTNIVRLWPQECFTTENNRIAIIKRSRNVLDFYLNVDKCDNKYFLINLENNSIKKLSDAAAADYLK